MTDPLRRGPPDDATENRTDVDALAASIESTGTASRITCGPGEHGEAG